MYFYLYPSEEFSLFLLTFLFVFMLYCNAIVPGKGRVNASIIKARYIMFACPEFGAYLSGLLLCYIFVFGSHLFYMNRLVVFCSMTD